MIDRLKIEQIDIEERGLRAILFDLAGKINELVDEEAVNTLKAKKEEILCLTCRSLCHGFPVKKYCVGYVSGREQEYPWADYMKQPEIKPCPFCGVSGQINNDFFVHQHRPGCFLSKGYGSSFLIKQCLNSWNTRA